MNSPPLVYIIVLTWNGKADTMECLMSLGKLSYQNFRIMVVDNASTDGTAEEVSRLHPAVRILRNESNLRFAGGNNAGIRAALKERPDYVLLLNNDTVVAEDFLDRLVSAAGSDEKTGIAGPKIYYHADPRRIWYAGGRVGFWSGSLSHIGVREIDKGQFGEMTRTGYITGCAMLVKRELLEKIGLLDESFYIYGEDADLSLRAVKAGYELLFVPGSHLWHKVSVSTGGHFSWFKNWNKLKGQLRLMARYAKCYHWLTIPVMMPLSIIISILRLKLRNVS